MRPGAKYYWWELRGVPLRLELGPRDLDGGKVMAVKRTGEKSQIELATVCDGVTRVLAEITDAIRAKAEEHTKSHLCSRGLDGCPQRCPERREGRGRPLVPGTGLRGRNRGEGKFEHPWYRGPLALRCRHGREVHCLRKAGQGNPGRADILNGILAIPRLPFLVRFFPDHEKGSDSRFQQGRGQKRGTARKETPVIFNNTGDRYLLNL